MYLDLSSDSDGRVDLPLGLRTPATVTDDPLEASAPLSGWGSTSKLDLPYMHGHNDVRRIDGKPMELVTIEAFGHTFRDVLPDMAKDLATLESDQAALCRLPGRQGEDVSALSNPVPARLGFCLRGG